MKSYCAEIIKEGVRLYFSFKSFRKVQDLMHIGKTTIQRWVASIGERVRARKYMRASAIRDQVLLELPAILANAACSSLRQIRAQVTVDCSLSWISKALRTLGVKRVRRSFKVFHGNRAKTEEKIVVFKQLVQNIELDQIVSLDETGFCNVGNDFYGYGEGFKSVAIHSPKRFKSTCIMAATADGILCHTVQRECARKTSFIDFVLKLIGSLHEKHKYILMDNISFHHSQEVRTLFEANGLTIIYCPPYSPRFNPVEHVFSILKSKFREKLLAEPSLGQVRFDEIIGGIIQTTTQAHTNFSRMFHHCVHSA